MENNCYIKPGVYYSHDTIRDKFGYYSQTVYDEKNKKLWYKYTKRYYETLPSPIKNRH